MVRNAFWPLFLSDFSRKRHGFPVNPFHAAISSVRFIAASERHRRRDWIFIWMMTTIQTSGRISPRKRATPWKVQQPFLWPTI